MKISEIVVQHGLPVKVWCNKPSYPPFTVVAMEGGDFRVEYDSGLKLLVSDGLDDYEVVA